jgi:DNA-binding winged helix-turn-helix (wHTH) protein/TolB-like protein
VKVEERHFFEFDRFRIDVEERRLTTNGQTVPLNPRDFDILLALVGRPGQTIDKNSLMDTVWGDTFVEEGNLSRHVSTLRKILGDDPRGQRFIKTIPKQGYRFTADVREVVQTVDTVAREDISKTRVLVREEITETVGTSLWRPVAVVASVSVAIVLAAAIWMTKKTDAGPPEPGTKTVAVIPFRNLRPDAETDFLGYALAQSITGRLGYVRKLIVRPTSAGERFRDESDTRVIGKALNSPSLVTGTYLKEGDILRVSVELVDVDNQQIVWQNSIDLEYSKLSIVQDRVAGELLRSLRLNLTEAETHDLQRYLPNPVAYEYDLRGIAVSRKSDYLSSLKMYEKAVEADPNYALAWTHIAAVCYFYANDKLTGPAYRARADKAIDRALQLEPDQIEARLEKAFQMIDNEGRGEEAIPILRGIIGTNDNNALAHWYLSQAYRYGGALDESITEGRRAVEIDPDVMWDTTFNSLFYAGLFEEFLSSMAHKPEGARTCFYRGLADLYVNDRDSAVRQFDRSYEIDRTYPHAMIGQAMKAALNGEVVRGTRSLGQLERDRSLTDGEMLYKLAQAHAMLGNKQDALRLLRRTVEQNFFCYPYFANDALLDNVRAEPEFAEFLSSARQRHEQFRASFF